MDTVENNMTEQNLETIKATLVELVARELLNNDELNAINLDENLIEATPEIVKRDNIFSTAYYSVNKSLNKYANKEYDKLNYSDGEKIRGAKVGTEVVPKQTEYQDLTWRLREILSDYAKKDDFMENVRKAVLAVKGNTQQTQDENEGFKKMYEAVKALPQEVKVSGVNLVQDTTSENNEQKEKVKINTDTSSNTQQYLATEDGLTHEEIEFRKKCREEFSKTNTEGFGSGKAEEFVDYEKGSYLSLNLDEQGNIQNLYFIAPFGANNKLGATALNKEQIKNMDFNQPYAAFLCEKISSVLEGEKAQKQENRMAKNALDQLETVLKNGQDFVLHNQEPKEKQEAPKEKQAPKAKQVPEEKQVPQAKKTKQTLDLGDMGFKFLKRPRQLLAKYAVPLVMPSSVFSQQTTTAVNKFGNIEVEKVAAQAGKFLGKGILIGVVVPFVVLGTFAKKMVSAVAGVAKKAFKALGKFLGNKVNETSMLKDHHMEEVYTKYFPDKNLKNTFSTKDKKTKITVQDKAKGEVVTIDVKSEAGNYQIYKSLLNPVNSDSPSYGSNAQNFNKLTGLFNEKINDFEQNDANKLDAILSGVIKQVNEAQNKNQQKKIAETSGVKAVTKTGPIVKAGPKVGGP